MGLTGTEKDRGSTRVNAACGAFACRAPAWVQYLFLIVLGALFFGSKSLAADIDNGEELHDSACISCHAKLMDGEPNKIYVRPDRVVKDRASLVKTVKRCEAVAEARWFDEEVDDVVEFLNHEFYKFK